MEIQSYIFLCLFSISPFVVLLYSIQPVWLAIIHYSSPAFKIAVYGS